MADLSKYENGKLCSDILEAFGGPANVKNAYHCITRLRLVPANRDLVDLEKLRQISGILKVVESSGQIQCVIGTTVPEVYNDFIAISGVSAGGTVEAEAAAGGVVRPADPVLRIQP